MQRRGASGTDVGAQSVTALSAAVKPTLRLRSDALMMGGRADFFDDGCLLLAGAC